MKNNFFDTRGIITQEAIEKLYKKSSNVSCECPEHLLDLLRAAKKFTAYQDQCLREKPNDEMTHQWLKSTSITLEHFISNTIVSLARMEGLIDENNNIL